MCRLGGNRRFILPIVRQDKLAKNSGCKSRTGKGLANHPGPESCAVAREGRREALTGETVGWVLSCETIIQVQGVDAVIGRRRQQRR